MLKKSATIAHKIMTTLNGLPKKPTQFLLFFILFIVLIKYKSETDALKAIIWPFLVIFIIIFFSESIELFIKEIDMIQFGSKAKIGRNWNKETILGSATNEKNIREH